MLRQVRFIEAKVEQINLQARMVRYAAGGVRRRRELTRDYLLPALGSDTNYFNMIELESPAVIRVEAGCGTDL